jgi:hypothetical protein
MIGIAQSLSVISTWQAFCDIVGIVAAKLVDESYHRMMHAAMSGAER